MAWRKAILIWGVFIYGLTISYGLCYNVSTMTRPKGSRSKSREGYARRTAALKARYGPDVFKEWGKKGGNPVLVKKDLEDSDVGIKETL